MTLSFQKRLLIGVLLLVVGITVTFAFIGVRVGSSFLRSRFEDRMHFLTSHFALNSKLGILLGDKNMLREVADNVLSEPDVVRLWIENKGGNVIFRAGNKQSKLNKEIVVPIIEGDQEEGQVFVYPKKNKLLGKAHLLYSTAGIDTILTKFRDLHILVGSGAGLVGLLVFSLFSRALVSPLKELVKATQQVAKGNFDSRVKEGTIPEIQQLSHAFNNMLTALQENRCRLDEIHRQVTEQKALAEVAVFSFTVAHEVKNPLGIIKGALDVLKKPEVDTETKSTMINYMEEEIVRLDRLIQDFLHFAKPRKAVFKKVDINNMTSSIITRSRLEWAARDIHIHLDTIKSSCIMQIDEDLVCQAILNVLQNACQACGEKGDVFVTIGTTAADWELAISDTGKGMSKEIERNALEPFFTTKAKGTGLGLAFVDRAMRMHNGTILISGNKSGGTTVKLVLRRNA